MNKKDLLKKIKKIKSDREISYSETNTIYIQVLTLFLLFLKLFSVFFFKSKFL